MKKSKPLHMRLIELRHAILLLRDAAHKVERNEPQYLRVMSGQLRALVGTGGREHTPLLIDLADHFKLGLPCYGAAISQRDDTHHKGFHFEVLISTRQIDTEQKPLDLREWLSGEKGPALVIDHFDYTPDGVIRLVADRFGGAHYDKNIRPQDLMPWMLRSSDGQAYVNQLLLELSQVVCDLGEYVLSVVEIAGLAAAGTLVGLGYTYDLESTSWKASER